MFPRIDLHTHSSCSDGVLTPAELVAHAALRQVELLALTDHDTLDGCAAARAACEQHKVGFVAGVELTCDWRDRVIHIVGLGIDEGDLALRAHCAAVLETRRTRISAIAQRLSAAGLPGEALAASARSALSPTRTHIARALHQSGVVDSVQRAFDKWLQRGRPGHVAMHWPDLHSVVQRIVQAGGVAVLAHPHRYRISSGVLRELLADFKSAGGSGIEVSLAGMSPADAARCATLARRFAMAGSVGSDFHEPDLPWRPVGRFAKLPDGVTPITEHLP
jgi:predicted metal-dependent phosphoesterase TrpH